ncbi:hypothetical protein GmHk_06G016946 [Glycine max]|nr:hypothetical protein GmHk_06G016946 [Glycine max]
MACTKKTGEMTIEAAKEIAEKIDVLAVAIGRPEHPGRVRAAGAGVTIKQYFGSAPRTSRIASSLPPDELQQLTQQIRDQLEESITEKVTRQVMASFSQLQSEMQSQAPPEPLVGPGPSGPRVSTKGSCVDPSGNDPETGDSDRCGLYIEADPARLVSVDEVKDADAPVPVPTAEVSLVGPALHTFLAWLTHLIKSLSHQVAVSPPKPPPKPDPEVDDPLYLMTLTIPELFLRPYKLFLTRFPPVHKARRPLRNCTRWSMSQHISVTVVDSVSLYIKGFYLPNVATYHSAGGRRVTRGMRVPRKEYARSRHQRLFEENVGKTGKDAIYELLSERFGSCIYARGRY